MIENKIAIYCRLSVEDYAKLNAGDDSESIQNQKLFLMDYALKQGWSIHRIYSDDDYSGLYNDRPAFRQMLADAEKGLFNIILCKNQSRFTREMEMVEKYLHGLFVLWGIRFVSVIDHVDTNVKGNKKTRQINGLINEWYCEDLSQNIRTVFRNKMEKGQFLAAFAPFGYLKNPENHHQLIIDEEAAKIVSEIYSLYLKGYSYSCIADTLTEGGILAPSAYKAAQGLKFANPNSKKYSEGYGIWTNNTVGKILRNKVYCGCLIQGRERKLSYKSNKVIIAPKEDWIVIENNHEAIISEKDFYTVQGLIDRKRTVHKPKNGYKGKESAHILGGKLKCLDCGSNMQKAAVTRDGTSFYLRCSLANKTKSKKCTPHSIKCNIILQAVEDGIIRLINSYFENENDAAELKACLEESGIAMKFIHESADSINTIIRQYANFSQLSHEIINDFIDTIEVGNDKIIINWLF